MRCSPLTVLVALCGVACTPDFPEPFWTGSYLAYSTTTSAEICEGSWRVQDRYVQALTRYLDVSVPTPLHFAYIDRSEVSDYCFQDDIDGCEYDGKAYSTRPVLFHELAHAVARGSGHEGARAFQEGFAEVFGNGLSGSKELVPADEVLRSFSQEGPHYYTAGLFIRFLIERHGLEPLLSLMRRTRLDEAFASVSSTFETEFGESLDAALLAFDEYPSCGMWENRIAVVECGLPAVPWANGRWEASSAVACGSEDVLGPMLEDEEMLVWTSLGLEIADAGDYVVEVHGMFAGTAGVRFTRCGSCWDSVDLLVEAGQTRAVTLTPGKYYATFIKTQTEVGELEVSLTHTP